VHLLEVVQERREGEEDGGWRRYLEREEERGFLAPFLAMKRMITSKSRPAD
jgi:hypothetical protein